MAMTNTEAAVTSAIQIVKQVEAAVKPGQQPMQIVFEILAPLSQIPAILQNKAAIAAEWKNPTVTDLQELAVFIQTNLKLTNPKTEAIATAATSIAISIYTIVETLKVVPAPVAAIEPQIVQ